MRWNLRALNAHITLLETMQQRAAYEGRRFAPEKARQLAEYRARRDAIVAQLAEQDERRTGS